MGTLSPSVESVRGGRTLEELLADTVGMVAAMGKSVDEAIERHRLLGESIVGEVDGRVVEIPADQIEPLASKRARRAAESQ